MKISFLYLFVFCFLNIKSSFAYESMIRHGYFSCVSCHNSTSGGGTLHEYGKVIASEFSAFPLKDLESKSPAWIQKLGPAIQLRAAHVGREKSSRNFFMQTDVLSTISLSKNSHLLVSLAKAPSPPRVKTPVKDNLYVRKLLYVYKPKENLYFELGRNSPPFGIHEPDHTMYIRAFNRRSVLDLPFQASISIYKERSRQSFYLLLPSYEEQAANREYALAFKNELYLKNINTVLGFDLLYGETDSIRRYFAGSYTKFFFGDFLVMSELNFAKRDILKTETGFNQLTYFLKLSYFLKDYWEIYGFIEYLDQTTPFEKNLEKRTFGSLFRVTENLSLLLEAKNEFSKTFYVGQIFLNLW